MQIVYLLLSTNLCIFIRSNYGMHKHYHFTQIHHHHFIKSKKKDEYYESSLNGLKVFQNMYQIKKKRAFNISDKMFRTSIIQFILVIEKIYFEIKHSSQKCANVYQENVKQDFFDTLVNKTWTIPIFIVLHYLYTSTCSNILNVSSNKTPRFLMFIQLKICKSSPSILCINIFGLNCQKVILTIEIMHLSSSLKKRPCAIHIWHI